MAGIDYYLLVKVISATLQTGALWLTSPDVLSGELVCSASLAGCDKSTPLNSGRSILLPGNAPLGALTYSLTLPNAVACS